MLGGTKTAAFIGFGPVGTAQVPGGACGLLPCEEVTSVYGGPNEFTTQAPLFNPGPGLATLDRSR